MQEKPAQGHIAAAMGYENLLVPALFRQWTEQVLDAARVAPGDRVLDVACGTGVLAREAAARVGPAGRVVGVDPDPGMLAVAGRLAPDATWRQGTAESLPDRDGAFDAVVSQFGLTFFADRDRFFGEARRVLVPGGRVAIAVWDALEHNPAYAAEVALLEQLAGAAAADAVRLPFTTGDRDALAATCDRAGLESIVTETRSGTGRFPSICAMVEADLRGWLPLLGIDLDEDLIERVLAAAEHVLADHVEADGSVVFDVSAHIVSGVTNS